MDAKEKLTQFAIIFVIAFIASVVVSYLYTLIVESAGMVNWELSIVLGIALGLVKVLRKD